MTATEWTKFDAADYLDSPEAVAEYLNACLEDDDPAELFQGRSVIARAKGMIDMARATGLGRESLYKALSKRSNPQVMTILAVAKALNLKLAFVRVME